MTMLNASMKYAIKEQELDSPAAKDSKGRRDADYVNYRIYSKDQTRTETVWVYLKTNFHIDTLTSS